VKIDYKTEEDARAQQRVCRAIDDDDDDDDGGDDDDDDDDDATVWGN
jgi:hypothetical protein